jgi:hypothetical protein
MRFFYSKSKGKMRFERNRERQAVGNDNETHGIKNYLNAEGDKLFPVAFAVLLALSGFITALLPDA